MCYTSKPIIYNDFSKITKTMVGIVILNARKNESEDGMTGRQVQTGCKV